MPGRRDVPGRQEASRLSEKYIRRAIAVAGGLTLAACAAGTIAATAATSPTVSASAGKPVVPPSLTHVTAYSIDTDNPVLTAIVSGPATGDYGSAEEGSAHGGELELNLSRGTFRLNVADIDEKFVEGTAHEPVFPRTCSTYVSVSDAVPIVPGSGTGAYQGIAGTFAATLTLNEVHNSPCATSLSILHQVIVLSGAGKITWR